MKPIPENGGGEHPQGLKSARRAGVGRLGESRRCRIRVVGPEPRSEQSWNVQWNEQHENRRGGMPRTRIGKNRGVRLASRRTPGASARPAKLVSSVHRILSRPSLEKERR